MMSPALAQGGPDLGLEFAAETGLTTTDIRTTIARIIRSFLGFLGILAVMIILYAGFLWMTAGGNEEQVSKAKKWMVNGVIGLVIILSAFTIVSFLFRAITGEDTTGVGVSGPGVGPGFGGGPRPSEFYVSSITPYGPGPSSGGWPKNYAITVTLSRPPAPGTIDASSVIVEQCNPRINSDGDSQDFNFDACSGNTVPLRDPLVVEGRKIIVKPQWPDPSPETDPTDFEGEYWYKIELVGVRISDSDSIDTLYCPNPSVVLAPEEDISSLTAPKDLCVRAVAMNDLRDVEPPKVRLNTPSSPPGFCSPFIDIEARATDDFLPSEIQFQLEDKETGEIYNVFVNEDGAMPDGVSTNTEQVNPYYSREIRIDTEKLPPGKAYTLSATAFDPVPRSSETVSREVIISPLHCCNEKIDPLETNNDSVVPAETGVDCGDGILPTMCGWCSGDFCSDDNDCNSGYCDPVTNTCVERPIIDSVKVADDESNPVPVDHLQGGVGTPVVIKGRFFTNRGAIIFMGDPEIETDDVQAPLCGPDSWRYLGNKEYEVVVTVPELAKTGPIRIVTSQGQFDDTTDLNGTQTNDEPPLEFDVSGPTLPGVCYLSPNIGPAGTEVTIHGAGFGAFDDWETTGGVSVKLGESDMSLVDEDTTWEDDSFLARVPAVRDGVYPVTVTLGGVITAPVSFSLVPPEGYESPKITEILPDNGPIGSYVTIVGTGFGRRKGTVKFYKDNPSPAPPDIALAGEPICDQNWFKNYIVVKVPEKYQSGGLNVEEVIHHVQVETVYPPDTSNTIDFTVNQEALRPGMCSITPDNGPPALPVYVSGEGFGEPLEAGDSVDFYVDDTTTMPATLYPSWTKELVKAYVPGSRTDRSTWPRTGPVYLFNGNLPSSNAIPYLVQDCNDPGAVCASDTFCCENGVCDGGDWNGNTQTRAACEPLSRDSSYGWIFSTDTLPSVPQVLERTRCSATAVQSPSPYKDSSDACINSLIQFEFTRPMKPASVDASTVIIEACGSGDIADCLLSAGNIFGSRQITVPTDGSGSVLEITPSSTLAPNTWYRVMLISRPPGHIIEDGDNPVVQGKPGVGIVENGNDRYLDGDFNKRQGGDYVYMFRTRDSNIACALDKVVVIPSRYTIDHRLGDPSVPGDPKDGFNSGLFAENCNPIDCYFKETPTSTAVAKYNIWWNMETTFLDPGVVPAFGECVEHMPVFALEETESTIISADAAAIGSTLTPKHGESDVRIKFADPYVKEYAPNCTEACVNSSIWAKFNVMMKVSTMNDTSTIDVIKCRNASCNPPFITSEQPTNLSFSTYGDIDTQDEEDVAEGFLISLSGGTLFDPSSYYLVKVKGGNDGVKSGSGVSLTGTNDKDAKNGVYFSWTFRTNDDGSPCAVNRVEISPEEVTLDYVGQRQQFTSLPYSEPNACDPNGQMLSPLSYNWGWSREEADDAPPRVPEKSVVAGFIDPTIWTAFPTIWTSFVDGNLLNTNPVPFAGCTSSCLLQGSQAATSQCGNGILEPGEQCETNRGWDPYCDHQTCLWTGTPLWTRVQGEDGCGDGNKEDGEACEVVMVCSDNESVSCSVDGDCGGSGGSGTCGVFPPGCIVPTTGPTASNGCLNEGSSGVTGSICGNGALEDGEDCDDGNTVNWDGCSADCLAHGTLPSCRDVVVTDEVKGDCVSFCGNGITEDGEDPSCDLVAGQVDPGCDPITCLRAGSNKCTDSSKPNCCGNGNLEPSAGEECDPENKASWCSSSCLLVGSSYLHDDPSFCGDGILGLGESLQCDGNSTNISGVASSQLPTVTPDANIDHVQVIVMGSYSGEGGAETSIFSGVPELPEKDRAEAVVKLSCVCDEQADPAAYCSQTGFPPGLGCDRNGCCADAPVMKTPTYPPDTSTNICRNTGVRIRFTRNIDESTAGAVSLFKTLPLGSSCDPDETVVSGNRDDRGWFGNIVYKVYFFFKELFGSLVRAGGHLTECPIEVTRAVSGKTIRLAPTNALEPGQLYGIRVTGGEDGLKEVNGVPMAGVENMTFTTGLDICVIESVSIEPASHLFTVAADLGSTSPADDQDGDHKFTAKAKPSGSSIPDAEIVSTPEYGFKWNWRSQPDTSVVVVESENAPLDNTDNHISNNFCEDGEDQTVPECNVDMSGLTAEGLIGERCGDNVCEGATAEYDAEYGGCDDDCRVTPGHAAMTDVIVRNEEHDDALNEEDNGAFPKNGEAVIYVAAEIHQGASRSTVEGSADIVTMLCDNPWPERRLCPDFGEEDEGLMRLPWDSDNPEECIEGERVWSPFYDPTTNVSFFYCRDAGAGDSHDVPLPRLSEDIVEISHPAPPEGEDGILTEYLFTFKDDGPWKKDAIGIRFSTNKKHRRIEDWYKASGFFGAPAPTVIGGYPALQDSRTAYVNAAAYVPGSGIFTNVNILSYSDDAAPETVAIFNQVLTNIDFNRLVKDSNYCIDAAGDPVEAEGVPGSCSTDIDCRFDESGNVIDKDKSKNWYCRSPKSKLQRDVTRIGDLLAARESLLQIPEGAYPKLLSGTFLTTRTNSAWSSWDGVLSEEAGTLLPKDPVNDYAECWKENFETGENMYDQETCWNVDDQLYMCPSGSQVYDYSGRGGLGFVLSGNLESSCLDLPEAICAETPGCEFLANNEGQLKPEYSGYPQAEIVTVAGIWSYYYGWDTFAEIVDSLCSIYGWTNVCGIYDDSNPLCSSYTYTGGLPYACLNYYESTLTLTPSGCQSITGASWEGETCLDRTQANCEVPDSDTTGCQWNSVGGNCEFNKGQIHLEGMPSYSGAICDSTPQGQASICGDGIVSPSEQEVVGFCEPGEFRLDDCPADDRIGKRTLLCTELCEWKNVNGVLEYEKDELGADICDAGFCGDGVVQSFYETCDDGAALNGTYGYCGLSCQTAADFCGDGIRQPSEACDCNELNGAYAFNGILAPENQYGLGGTTPICRDTLSRTASCAWDCQSAGPRCGDGIINSQEQCDGGFEEFKGYCSDTSGNKDPADTGCNQNEDCPVGYTCGNFCPTVEQKNTRACRPNILGEFTDDDAACTWTSWTCTLPGVCGNGVVETGEQCDDLEVDGTLGDAGECVMHKGVRECMLNVCGDGYIYGAGGEECDEAGNNGQICIPSYDRQCTFCTAQCKVQSVSGGYCGNGLLENSDDTPPGPEECDGAGGFSGNWVCVSQREEHQSYGVITGPAICSASECRISCADPQSNPCKNDLSSPNVDEGTGSGDLKEAFAASEWNTLDYMVASTAPYGSQTALIDSCDPDKDGDGVPFGSSAECDDNDPLVHGDYFLEYDPTDSLTGLLVGTSEQIDITAASELCNNKDDDCDGLEDELIRITGEVWDARLDTGVAGATVRTYCNGVELATATTDATGTYVIDTEDTGLNCSGLEISVDSPGFCFSWDDRVIVSNFNIPGDYCNAVNAGRQLLLTPAPLPNEMIFLLQWGPGGPIELVDLDSHAKSSNGEVIYYGIKTQLWGSLDVDDLSDDGLETVTIIRNGTDRYRYYIINYRAGTSGSGQLKAAASNVRVRLWEAGCVETTFSGAAAGIAAGADADDRGWHIMDINADGSKVIFDEIVDIWDESTLRPAHPGNPAP